MPAPYTDTHDPSTRIPRKDSKAENIERTEKKLERIEEMVGLHAMFVVCNDCLIKSDFEGIYISG